MSDPDLLLPLDAALGRMLHDVAALPPVVVAAGESLGCVLAADVVASHTMPPWDDSAMDGYAVRSIDVASASRHRPVTLRVVGEVAAGHAATEAVGPGSAMRILTGAMLPAGADAVVRVEDTDAPAGVTVLPTNVSIRVAVPPGTSIRRAGSDVVAGDIVLPAGRLMAAHRIGALVAAGHATASVVRRPRVAILATGDELVPAGEPLLSAQIPDSSSATLAAQVRDAGGVPIPLGIARDDRADIIARLRDGIARADIVVASGGVSVGAHDEVRLAFEAIGRIDLWRVAIQPGKPLAFGRAAAAGAADASDRADARDTVGRADDTEALGRPVLLFGLPGNPVSSFVTFELFVRPVMRRMAGHADLMGRTIVRARLADGAGTDVGRQTYLRVSLSRDRQGSFTARLAGGQGSHMLSGLAAADGLAVVPVGVGDVDAGAEVDVISFGWDPGMGDGR